MDIRQTVASNLYYYRKRKKLSQNKIAAMLGVKTSVYQHWERGRVYPGVVIIVQLKAIYGLKSTDQLLE